MNTMLTEAEVLQFLQDAITNQKLKAIYQDGTNRQIQVVKDGIDKNRDLLEQMNLLDFFQDIKMIEEKIGDIQTIYIKNRDSSAVKEITKSDPLFAIISEYIKKRENGENKEVARRMIMNKYGSELARINYPDFFNHYIVESDYIVNVDYTITNKYNKKIEIKESQIKQDTNYKTIHGLARNIKKNQDAINQETKALTEKLKGLDYQSSLAKEIKSVYKTYIKYMKRSGRKLTEDDEIEYNKLFCQLLTFRLDGEKLIGTDENGNELIIQKDGAGDLDYCYDALLAAYDAYIMNAKLQPKVDKVSKVIHKDFPKKKMTILRRTKNKITDEIKSSWQTVQGLFSRQVKVKPNDLQNLHPTSGLNLDTMISAYGQLNEQEKKQLRDFSIEIPKKNHLFNKITIEELETIFFDKLQETSGKSSLESDDQAKARLLIDNIYTFKFDNGKLIGSDSTGQRIVVQENGQGEYDFCYSALLAAYRERNNVKKLNKILSERHGDMFDGSFVPLSDFTGELGDQYYSIRLSDARKVYAAKFEPKKDSDPSKDQTKDFKKSDNDLKNMSLEDLLKQQELIEREVQKRESLKRVMKNAHIGKAHTITDVNKRKEYLSQHGITSEEFEQGSSFTTEQAKAYQQKQIDRADKLEFIALHTGIARLQLFDKYKGTYKFTMEEIEAKAAELEQQMASERSK